MTPNVSANVGSDNTRYGWASDFPTFTETPPQVVRERLQAFVTDASEEQIRAWRDAIPSLQTEVGEVLDADRLARRYSTILEYELPMESRRPDVILLVGAAVMVVELKGRALATQADIDQAAAYARDLRCYHRECASRAIIPVLMPTRCSGYQYEAFGVHVTGPDALDDLVTRLVAEYSGEAVNRERFLDANAYSPLPTLVEAAREIFAERDVRWNTMARAATDGALTVFMQIVHDAAATRTKHLVLLTGAPGTGKTLVGLRAVHAPVLDELTIPREAGKSAASALFLSGNNPLVSVLQYALRTHGSDGKTFVRRMKDFISRYASRPELIPPEHVLVFDEAQRAFDEAMMRRTHGASQASSEPELFLRIAARIPGWCVVLALVGTGQEIHIGEEAGLQQWRNAVLRIASETGQQWTVHAHSSIANQLEHPEVRTIRSEDLRLKIELRYHNVRELHDFVEALLTAKPAPTIHAVARSLEKGGFQFRLTRSLERAKAHIKSRYEGDFGSRFGLLASSRDKALQRFGVPNGFKERQRMKIERWYVDDETYSEASCRHLNACATEFEAQGLELDGTILAWGTDFALLNGQWSNALAARYASRVTDPFGLRLNAYRVLLTRARDTCVVFVPPLPELDETYAFLNEVGFVSID